MKHEELTHQIIGLAMKVHRVLGAGFQEVIYHRKVNYKFLYFTFTAKSKI